MSMTLEQYLRALIRDEVESRLGGRTGAPASSGSGAGAPTSPSAELGDAAQTDRLKESGTVPDAASPALPPWPKSYRSREYGELYDPTDVEPWRDAALVRIAALERDLAEANRAREGYAETAEAAQALGEALGRFGYSHADTIRFAKDRIAFLESEWTIADRLMKDAKLEAYMEKNRADVLSEVLSKVRGPDGPIRDEPESAGHLREDTTPIHGSVRSPSPKAEWTDDCIDAALRVFSVCCGEFTVEPGRRSAMMHALCTKLAEVAPLFAAERATVSRDEIIGAYREASTEWYNAFDGCGGQGAFEPRIADKIMALLNARAPIRGGTVDVEALALAVFRWGTDRAPTECELDQLRSLIAKHTRCGTVTRAEFEKACEIRWNLEWNGFPWDKTDEERRESQRRKMRAALSALRVEVESKEQS